MEFGLPNHKHILVLAGNGYVWPSQSIYYQTRNSIHNHDHIHIYIYVCHNCFSNSNPINTMCTTSLMFWPQCCDLYQYTLIWSVLWLEPRSKSGVKKSLSFPSSPKAHHKLLTLHLPMVFQHMKLCQADNCMSSILTDAIRYKFLPAITGKGAFSDTERALLALPVWLWGLGIVNPATIPASLYMASISITAPTGSNSSECDLLAL